MNIIFHLFVFQAVRQGAEAGKASLVAVVATSSSSTEMTAPPEDATEQQQTSDRRDENCHEERH